MKCRQRLYLTADRKKVVAEGDKKAASLYAVPGDEIPQSAHDLFGLVDGHLKGFDPTPPVVETPEPERPEPTIAATQVLHHSTENPDQLVPADDPAAGKLYANIGDLILKSMHDAFGLVDGALPAAAGGGKEAAAGSDKEQKGGSDKSPAAAPDKESADQAATSGDKA